MSRRLTQPEEIDQILKEMAEEESSLSSPFTAGKRAVADWGGPYVPPYRAEYIKAHGIPDQGESRQR